MAEDSIEVLSTGAEAPDFELQGTDGETHSLDSFADYEAVLLVFTCNHCPYLDSARESRRLRRA
jgi:peroxiredoxin